MASPRLCITVAPFTGGPFEVRVAKSDTIEDLKKVIARRLKVAKERMVNLQMPWRRRMENSAICLCYRLKMTILTLTYLV